MARKKLPIALRKALSALATTIHKPKNAVLFRVGQPCRGAFLIRSGEVKLSLDEAAHLYRTRTVRSGFIIGLPAVFSGEPYSLTAQTKTACKLDFVPRKKLLALLRQNPEVGFDIVRLLSNEIHQMRTVAKRHLSGDRKAA
jgi:CRP-like cAMP-binding protein